MITINVTQTYQPNSPIIYTIKIHGPPMNQTVLDTLSQWPSSPNIGSYDLKFSLDGNYTIQHKQSRHDIFKVLKNFPFHYVYADFFQSPKESRFENKEDRAAVE